MLRSLLKKSAAALAAILLPCAAAFAMPAPGAAIHVPKPGAIGSHMPRPTVPVGNYQHPGQIPMPMTRPVTAAPVRPIPMPKISMPSAGVRSSRSLPGDIGLSRQARQLFVYRPALHLYSWQQPSMLVGPMGFQALAHNPQLSAAWWKPLPLWNQGDIMNALLPRLTETIK